MKKLILPSDTRLLSEVEPFLRSALGDITIPQEQYSNAVIALTEAVNNGFRHGNQSIREKSVTIEIECYPNSLVMTVTDEGNGFDPDSLPNPLEPENLLREGGRGVFLIRLLCTASEFEYTGAGMKTMMTISF